MSNFKIPLNGGNYVSRERQQAFEEALNDDHSLQVSPDQTASGEQFPAEVQQSANESQPPRTTGSLSSKTGSSSNGSSSLAREGLNRSFEHQNRTLDVHQQYLDQQDEYIQLLFQVVQQQGKILESMDPGSAQSLLTMLQGSLDGLNHVQERSLEIHQQFLEQQSSYAERFVQFLQTEKTDNREHLEPELYSNPVETTSPLLTGQDPEPDQEIIDKPAAREVELPREPEVRKELPNLEPAAAPGNLPELEQLSQSLLEIVADKTGYPVEMLELEMDLEADLGVDSIKRVEILGTLEETYPDLPEADTQVLAETRTLQDIVNYLKVEMSSRPGRVEPESKPADPPSSQPLPQENDPLPVEVTWSSLEESSSTDKLTAMLLEIVADKTGYPVEMLEPEMDMEADLGIDSIKRVEILGTMEDQNPDLPAVETDQLAELRTLQEVIDFLNTAPSAGQENPVPDHPSEEPPLKKKQPGPKTKPVSLIQLPEPDRLDYQITENQQLLVSGCAGDLNRALVTELEGEGWSITRLGIDVDGKNGCPADILLSSSDPESWENAISQIESQPGEIAGFIHLQPSSRSRENGSADQHQITKLIFFLAKHLQKHLNQGDQQIRKSFLLVTQMDGKLGLDHQSGFQTENGLSGLVKTLHWEWPQVFCRAVDLDPALDTSSKIDKLLLELRDPDHSVLEVGWTEKKRSALLPLPGR